MKILERYIAKTVIAATLMTALIITAVLFIMLLLGEMKTIGEGDYTLDQAVWYVLLRMPNEMYQFSPMIVLLGSIIGLNILSAHKELAVMRASGFSLSKVMLSVFAAALFVILTIGSIGEWAAPDLSFRAETGKENAKNGGLAVVTSSGVWLHVDNNFIHVQHVVGRQLFEGVTRYEYDREHRLIAAYFAKRLSWQNNHWQMYNVLKTTFLTERTQSEFFPLAEWNLKFNPSLLNVGLIEPNEMSLHKLKKFARYLKQNGLQASEYQYEYWHRVFQPLASLIMILIAIPFVLGTLTTATTSWRLIVGILSGFAFYILNALLGQVCIVYQVPAILAAFIPLIMFTIVGLFLSNRLIRQ